LESAQSSLFLVLLGTQKTHPCGLGIGHPWPLTALQDQKQPQLRLSNLL
jgi:hypothetical protein